MSDIKIDDKWLHRHGAYDTKNCHVNGWPDTGSDDGDGYPTYPYDVYDCQGHEGTYDESTLTATINGIPYAIDLEAKTCKISAASQSNPYSPKCDDGKLILDWIVVYGERYFLTSIGSFAFYNCTSLTSVVILDSVTTIGDSAFRSCTSLESVVIPDSVTSIGSFAFYNCTSLESVVIPDSVTSIGSYAFSYCTSLESVVIPDSVTSIGSNAFAFCTSLESVVIGDSVTTIGSYAFYGCTSLESVVIPDSVTSIAYAAFGSSSSIKTVYYGGTSSSDWDSISNSGSNTYLDSATRYYYSETQPTEEGNYWHWDSDGNPVIW